MGRRGNNEGSITKRKDGRWQARVSMPDGTRSTVYGKTRSEVKAKMDDLLGLAEQRSRLIPGRGYSTFGDFLSTWVINVGSSVKPTTADFYEQHVRLYTGDLASIPPERLKAQHIQQVYAKMLKQGLSSTTVRHLHATLHRAFDSAVRQGIMLQNLCDQVDAPRIVQKEMLTFTIEQSRRFLEASRDRRYEALFVLAISTGMRQGELLGLTWENLDLDRGILYVKGNLQWLNREALMQDPKTKHGRRRIFLGSLARQALTEHRVRQQQERETMEWGQQRWNLVFTTLKGAPLHPSTLVHQHYEPLLKVAELPKLRFHDLRHSAATHLLEAGINPKIVSEMLGHSSVSITLALYSHVTASMSYSASMVLDKVLRGEINPLALPEGLEDSSF